MPLPEAVTARPAVKTVAALALLQSALPLNLALTAVALLRSALHPPPEPAGDGTRPRTVLLSGGKMTKALTLARSFHAAGHRVILVEQAKYRFTGHRFSRAVDRFYTVPPPQAPGYADALVEIVRREGVDVYVPVCSPVASLYDALAKAALEPYCEVLHEDPQMVAKLDDKYDFASLAHSLGLSAPDSHRVTAPQQVESFDFEDHPAPYILKSIPYDPVHRLDLTPLPAGTVAGTAAFARSKPMSPENPWVMQEFVRGREFCTHSTVRDGEVQVYACCPSSAFQVNYVAADRPRIEEWVRAFVGALKLTGQVSLDVIETPDGEVYPIECNPRTHSAITLFSDHPDLARAYLESGVETIRPLPGTRPTYWLYHEVWRLLTQPGRVARMRTVLEGRDAIFDWSDPLPFLLVHHLQIPSLLLGNLRRGKDWVKIDFNIGKLVEPAGD